MRAIVRHTQKNTSTESLHTLTPQSNANINNIKPDRNVVTFYRIYWRGGNREITYYIPDMLRITNYVHLQALKCDTNESRFDCLEFSVTNTSCGYEQRLCFINIFSPSAEK